jgi:hypothetical protein
MGCTAYSFLNPEHMVYSCVRFKKQPKFSKKQRPFNNIYQTYAAPSIRCSISAASSSKPHGTILEDFSME